MPVSHSYTVQNVISDDSIPIVAIGQTHSYGQKLCMLEYR